MFVLSAFAGTAAAAHNLKDPEHDNLFPDANFGETGVVGQSDDFPPEDGQTFATRVRKAFDGDENFPGADWDEKNFPGADWDGDGSDDEEFQDGSDPVVVSP